MLLELKRSRVASEGLDTACRSIVELLHQLAKPEPDPEAIRKGWEHRGKPSKDSLEAVASLAVGQRGDLLAAVEADLEFVTRLEDSEFAFGFAQLDAPTREAGRTLFDSMYRDVFGGKVGFEFGDAEYANRTTWESDFRQANPDVRICPACLISELGPPVNKRTIIDADHYLPKSAYPPLAVHGLNLTPMCKPCNQSLKRNKDPLGGNGNERLSLPDIWFPYVRFGLNEIDFTFAPDGNGDLQLEFTGPTEALARAQRFDAIFELRAKWSSVVENLQQQLRIDLLSVEATPDADSIREKVKMLMTLVKGRETNSPRSMVELTFYKWVLEDDSTIAALAAQLERGEPPNSARHTSPSRD